MGQIGTPANKHTHTQSRKFKHTRSSRKTKTPVHNFVLAGDWSAQKFLGSMEGAVLAGKLASEVVACKAAGVPTPNGGPRVPTDAPVPADAPEAPSAPGFAGESPVAFGGGQTGGLAHP